MPLSRLLRRALALILMVLALPTARADTIALFPIADNTMYNEDGSQSNGAGNYFFAGRTDRGELRRGLIRFDLSAIPAGSTVTGVSLSMYMSRTRSGAETVALHRVTASWGEGTSHAPGEEGSGAGATIGDATWTHRFYNTQTWTTPGGDFIATASATTTVDNRAQFYAWNGPGLVVDVQAWVDSPATNAGWIVIGNEAVDMSSKRFESRQSTDVTRRPILTVTYTPGGGSETGACCLPAGGCIITTQLDCEARSGVFKGIGVPCTPDPCAATQVYTAPAIKDNTLYQDPAGALSNGAGIGFFAGTSDTSLARRGLVKFDLGPVPANAVISGVKLRLYMGWTQAPAANMVAVHRVLADWGEGTSDASGQEIAGAPSAPGDATWIHRFYPGTLWAAAGGDFAPTASASTSIPVTTGFVEWTSPGLIADVQSWVSGPAGNHGWLLIGAEGAQRTARRMDSRQAADVTRRPQLIVEYSIPTAATGACCLPDGTCLTLTASQCAAQGGTYQGDGVACAPGLCPVELTPFVDALPRPAVAQPVTGVPGGEASYEMVMQEFPQQLHRDLPPTTVWGFNGGYPGPTIEARTGLPVIVSWINDLRDSSGVLRTTHYLPVDHCLHGAMTHGDMPRTVVHLHGGHVPPEADGYPDDTFEPGDPGAVTIYPNNQDAATIWYHDHALGITRLNVYMGLAGFYLIRDPVEDALTLPDGEFEIPLAIQDRTFNPDGSLRYLEMWHEHFFGDKILVNGKVWPYLEVKRGLYRFRLLNGSNSRTYTLSLSDGSTFWQIGSDLGLLDAPVAMTQITITPGERADVVMDFTTDTPGSEIRLVNSAPAPYPGTPGVGVIPDVMKFIVTADPGFVGPLPAQLRPVERLDEAGAAEHRSFSLRKVDEPCAGSQWLINDLGWHDSVTEYPELGTTEVWSFINRSGMIHPMHMHLVRFQLLDRQAFDIVDGQVVPVGPRFPPGPGEDGWKDTIRSDPNMITRVIAEFEDYAGLYPYHCHILEHEDHDMMRQFRTVCGNPADLTGDDQLDFADYLEFLNLYDALDPKVDYNQDGLVDFSDYLEFLNYYEVGC